MTFEQYTKHLNRLAEVFPQHFSTKARVQLIFERIKDMDESWLRRTVDRIILSNDPRFNFDDAARAERLARRNQDLTNDIVKASEVMNQKISDNGLNDVLKKLGANSLLDAIINKKGVKNE